MIAGEPSQMLGNRWPITGRERHHAAAQMIVGAAWGEGASYPSGEDRGQGWVTFAGIMLMIAGVLNVIYGISAIDEAHFYIADTKYVIGELATWGRFLTVLDAVQVCAALGIWARQGWARWAGVGFAAINAIIQLLYLPAYVWLSLAIFALDLLVTYGGKLQEA
jgi:hypothetical protein